MVDAVEKFELYHDSGVSEPKEGPAAIRDRLSRLAERRGIDFESFDLADRDADDWSDRRRDLVGSVRRGREYVVDGRVFTDETFGRHRPVLVVRYGDDVDGVDLYPHRRSGSDSGFAMTHVGDFLDDFDARNETDRSDREELAEASDPDGTDATDDEPGAEGPVNRRSVLRGVAGTGAVAAGVAFVGPGDVPVLGRFFDCGPGETEVASVGSEMTGTTVEIMGTIDYSLDDTQAFTAFRLDGQTATVPVYLAGTPESELGFGDCLRIRGEVQSGESKPVEGPVVADATVVN
jgi:hypothetical protein